MNTSHIFGPVCSSRLGRSLGLDLLGQKICSFDCLYCEVGRTMRKTMERKPYVPADTILDQLHAWLAGHDLALDFVTLGGSGEPCLNSDLGAIIQGAKKAAPGTDTDVAVLTNSTLLIDPAVRKELLAADVVLPSLDTLVPKEYARLNRPEPSLLALGPEALARALTDFRSEFSGRLYLEIFLSAGVNDTEENLERLRDFTTGLKPDRVDVVTLSRPGAFSAAKPASSETMARWKEIFAPLARGDHSVRSCAPQAPDAPRQGTAPDHSLKSDPETLRAEVLQSLRRRPQTTAQLASALGVSMTEMDKALETLLKQGHILSESSGSRTHETGTEPPAEAEPFYKANKP